MLYIRMDNKGHYLNDKWVDTPIVPYLSHRELGDGCHDWGLMRMFDTEKFELTKSNTTIWILSQDQITPWTNTYSGHYGRSKGGVIAHRLRDTDIVIYEMPEGSWFVSDKTVYHNDGGVLVRYSVDSIIGWETWDSIPHRFYPQDAIEFRKKISR